MIVSNNERVDYEVIARTAVKNNLKAPSVADFKFGPLITRNKNIVLVRGKVDAQNSFGAMIRSNYKVKIQLPDKKVLEVHIKKNAPAPTGKGKVILFYHIVKLKWKKSVFLPSCFDIMEKTSFFTITSMEVIMEYITLKQIFYEKNEMWETEYHARFNSSFTKHLDFDIKEYNHADKFKLFYCYNEDISQFQNNILAATIAFFKCLEAIPGAGIKQFIEACLVDEIKASNDIEGVRSTRKEIMEAFDQKGKPKKYLRLWGIVNKYKKIINNDNVLLNTCQDIRNLYDDFILDEILRDDPQCVPDGNLFRKDSVDIITSTQKTIHRGIYPESKIIATMTSALNILHDKSIPSLIRISIFHYLFGYIHPFYDGNGRMSRFITSYYLAKEIHPSIALRLSLLIKLQKNKYYSLFHLTNSCKNRGDITPFIIRSLELVLIAIQSTTTILEKKLILLNDYRNKMNEVLDLSDKTVDRIYDILLQASIFSNSGASIEEISNTMNKNPKTIRKYIDLQPKENIEIDKTIRPYRYKLNTNILK